MVNDCFNLEDSLKRYKLVVSTVKSVVSTDVAIDESVVPTESGETAGVRPKERFGIPSHEFGLIKYLRLKTKPSTAPKFKLDQDRLCHLCFENEGFDKVVALCKRNKAFLKRYGISMERVSV